MATKVREIPQGLGLAACDPVNGGCCSNHRRSDRVYEDQLWAFAQAHPGHRAHDPACP